MQKIFNLLLSFLCLLNFSIVGAQTYWGSGSRDFAKNNIGSRVFMMSMACADCPYNPFPQQGTVYVYAKVGETIYVGSSVQGRNADSEIRMFPPNGKNATGTNPRYYSSGSSTTTGRIQNRAQEKIGPAIAVNPNSGGTGGYAPFARTVAAGEEGIWVINFQAPGNSSTQSGDTGGNSWSLHITPDADWATLQNTLSGLSTPSGFIAAWDATVVGKDNVIKSGRVFIKNFNGSTYPTLTNTDEDGFYGIMYALTKDGFAYKLSNNGQNGLSFNSFVNNTGPVVNATVKKEQTYLSFSGSTAAAVRPKIWDPRVMDDLENGYITHKMFYAPPDPDMPAEAPLYYWYPGDDASNKLGNNGSTQTTWLKPVRVHPKLKNVNFIGSEGTPNQAGAKGGNLIFESNTMGKYEITVPLSGIYATRVLTGDAYEGTNSVYWDGLDANGLRVQSGTSISGIKSQVNGAEIHFPFIDVENNPRGVIIEQLQENYSSFAPARYTVYWDNTGLSGSVNPSNTHKNNSTSGGNSNITTQNLRWGVKNSSANNFGDGKVIDIWTYAPGEEDQLQGIDITVKSYDLEVVSVTKTSPAGNYVSLNDNFSYNVVIKNNGPEDAMGDENATFFFYLPSGTTINMAGIAFSSTNGASIEAGSSQIITNKPGLQIYKVKLNIPNGSGGQFSIPAKLTSGTPTSKINAWAGIMRNNDMLEPNASNTDHVNIPSPRDAFEEANGIWKQVTAISLNAVTLTQANLGFNPAALTLSNPATSTNNIKYNNSLSSNLVASTTLAISKTGVKASSNGATTFYITVKNIGANVSTNTIMTDELGSFNIATPFANYSVPRGTVNYTASPKQIKWNIGTLLPGEEVTMTFVTSNGSNSYENKAKAVSNEAIEVETTVTITTTTTNINASVIKTVANHATASNKVTFTVVFTKPGTTSGTYTATVVDYLPKGYVVENIATDISITGGAGNTRTYNSSTRQIVWNLSFTETNSATRTMTVHAKLLESESPGDFENIAQITKTSTTDTDISNNTATVNIKSDLRVTKTVDIVNPFYDTNVVFTIKAENFNRSAAYYNASGVKVFDLFPNGYDYVDHTVDSGNKEDYNPATGFWNIGNLKVGNSVNLYITAKVKRTGNYPNIVTISGSQTDDIPANNTSLKTIIPRGPALLISNPMIYQRTK